MILAIDIDDVLYPFVDQFKDFAEGYLGMRLSDLTQWDIASQWFISKEDVNVLFDHFIRESGYSKGAPISGALTHIRSLSRSHEIILATTRGSHKMPLEGRIQLIQDTADWLGYYRIPFHHLFFTGNKGLLNADVLLDDNLQNLKDFRGRSIAFSRPWNESWEGERVSSWKEFYELITRG